MVQERRYEPSERPQVTRVEGGAGSPDLVVESLPADQEDQEYAILEKFIGALKHFESRDISGPYRRGDQWPDFEKGTAADALGIELTWVTHEPHDHLRRLQEQYARRVKGLLAKVDPTLAGLHFHLEDGYQDPPYPPLSAAKGEAVAQSIAALIESDIPTLATLPVWSDPGRPPVQRLARETGPGGVTIGYVAHRFAHAESGADPIIRFFGSFPIDKGLLDTLLWRAIERKLDKAYATYPGQLWLVVWGGAWVGGVPPSAAAAFARQRLAMTSHPFDAIWVMSPYPGQELGSIERVWG
jgi:hypothetical protein